MTTLATLDRVVTTLATLGQVGGSLLATRDYDEHCILAKCF